MVHVSIFALLFGVLAQEGAEPPQGAATGAENDIQVEIVGLRNDRGSIRCALFASPQGFPSDASATVQAVSTEAEQGHATCRFTDLTPGVYAISFFHDENQNEKLDTGFLGKPKEGYGASRNAHRTFGPPRFEDARFEYTGGQADFRLSAHY